MSIEPNRPQSWLQVLGPLSLGLMAGSMLTRLFIQPNSEKLERSPRGSPLTREDVESLLAEAVSKGEVLNLEGADLRGVDLQNLELTRADLRGADLSQAKVGFCKLMDADLRDANAAGVSFDNVELAGARIHGIRLGDGYLPAYVFRRAGAQERTLGDWEHAQTTGDIRDHHYAREAALLLKNHLHDRGRYLEAVWAHQLEQRILRALINPRNRIRWDRERGKRVKPLKVAQYAGRWLTSVLADLVSGYGEEVGRVLVTLVAVQALFTLGYLWSGSIVDAAKQPVSGLWNAVVFSLGALTTTNLQNLHPASSAVEFVMGLQVVIGIALTGLLGFVLGNRIRYSW